MHLIFAATLLINLILNQSKGKNMEPLVHIQQVPKGVTVLGVLFMLFMILVILIVTALMTWAFCKIFSRAGYSWALGLLMLVPIANIIVPFILAFADWPIQKELCKLKQQEQKPQT